MRPKLAQLTGEPTPPRSLLRSVPNDDEERPVAMGESTLDDVTDPAPAAMAGRLDKSPAVDLLLEVEGITSAPSDLREAITVKQIFRSPFELADIDQGTLIL